MTDFPDARPPQRYALPRSIYVFLVFLVLSYLTPSLARQFLMPSDKPKPGEVQVELSDADFDRYVTAETTTRTAFASHSSSDRAPASDTFSQRLYSALGSRREPLLRDARREYAALAKTTHAPNMDRRVLILDHALGLKFEPALLDHGLRTDLRLARETRQEISSETALWSAIYGEKQIKVGDAATDERLVRAMHLGFLEPKALSDMWSAARNFTARDVSERELHSTAIAYIRGEFVLVSVEILAFVAGAVFLVLFIAASISGDWRIVRRAATQPLHLLWGELLDVFVFYLAFYRTVSIIIGLVVRASGAEPGAHGILLIEGSTQIATGAVALAYLAAKAKRHNVTLAEVGMTVRGSIAREMGYGVAGYLAGLPLMLLMALISRLIFRHSTNTTPNPILPLMIGVHDPVSRTMIFVMASLAAPFFEETFFRGALFTGLRTRYGWWSSALLSAMCFALVHPMQDWLPIFSLGLTFAIMREMRQSLVPSMTAHFLQNSVTFIALSSLFGS